jgi:hypothetical protein
MKTIFCPFADYCWSQRLRRVGRSVPINDQPASQMLENVRKTKTPEN